ncbi:MAG: ECF transporter S component, partial [Eubacteriales bacterium]
MSTLVKPSTTHAKYDTKTIITLAMLTAIAYLVMLLCKPLPSVNGYLDFDFKDVVICIGGFVYGPAAAALLTVSVSLLQLFTGVSTTGFIGLTMNIIATGSFC